MNARPANAGAGDLLHFLLAAHVLIALTLPWL